MKSTLNLRLLCAAELVRQNATFADIGTDHAYLPLFLLDLGRIDYAYCCDINEGPLDSARRNAEERGKSEQMSFILTDGAAALLGKGITDYAICGMGGELIAEIIERAPHLRTSAVNLILQPMTRQEKLRTYLASHGFSIKTESYCYDAGKHYVCMLVSFDGNCRELSELEAVVGSPKSVFLGTEHRLKYLKSKLSSLERASAGKSEAGMDCKNDNRLIAELTSFIKTL